ncbi:MAG: M20/M25/M40 family metallo-hydrolase [Deltaproteobacteria bacterium]|nr:M20/M25/M40 family metallo-hydrolase [Deltaproteobacteria bacterium]
MLIALFVLAAMDPVYAEIKKQHAQNIERLQQWIALPSIAAENLASEEGATKMMALLKEAGFQRVERVATDGKPGVFATLDAGAKKSLGLYFMYDVKQYDPKEWSSPPLAAAIVDKPGMGKIMIGRGTVNQKGPQAAFLAALLAFKAAGQKLPVNLVLVAEGEEEIGSPHFHQIVKKPEVQQALSKTIGVFMPSAAQALDGEVVVSLGAKGVVELELVASGEKWGRGPQKDVHSGQRARIDSPAFHLVQALATLVNKDGDPAIDGFADAARALTADENAMIESAAKRSSEADAKKTFSVTKWAHDVSWKESLVMLAARPTVNIEGLVGGYTGPGGKTVLPNRAVAKIDLRLVPNMRFDAAVLALRAHLKKRGFGDIEVNVSGGYDPTETKKDAWLVRAQQKTYASYGIEAPFWVRNAGSYPGFVFTNPPLSLPAGHFGLGHGGGAHAPDEYILIESATPKLKGYDDAIRSFADYLVTLAEGS